MDDAGTVRWRRDASNSRAIRLLWAFGVGTLLGAISLVVVDRFYALAVQTGGRNVLVAAVAGLAVTILAVAIAGRAEERLERLTRGLPISVPEGAALERLLDVLVVAVVVGGLILALARMEGGVSNFVAALTLPVSLVALVLAVFLRSAGAIDPAERRLYLFDPDEEIDLDVIEAVSVRRIAGVTIVNLEYATPNGQYVPGPRRLVVPEEAAGELESLVGTRS